jgi:hypothetical protein
MTLAPEIFSVFSVSFTCWWAVCRSLQLMVSKAELIRLEVLHRCHTLDPAAAYLTQVLTAGGRY